MLSGITLLFIEEGVFMLNYVIESNSHNPWYNLAAEYYLMTRVRKGDAILYLWQNESTVVIGRNQNALQECRVALLEEENGCLARRTTGGGAVYHDLGNLCFTFLASPERYDLKRQLSVVMNACANFGINTCYSGRNDILTEDGSKFSGNAFSATNTCNIQHGTLMINLDKSKLSRYLTPSAEKIRSKGIGSVRSRVCNLKDFNENVTAGSMKEQLIKSFEREYGTVEFLNPEEFDNDTVKERFELYSSGEWKFGKSPACEISYQKRFDWGEIEVQMNLNGLVIRQVKIYSDTLEAEVPQLLENLMLNRRYDLSDLEMENTCGGTDRDRQITEVIEWLRSIET